MLKIKINNLHKHLMGNAVFVYCSPVFAAALFAFQVSCSYIVD